MEIGNPIALYFLALAAGGALLFIYEMTWARRTIASFAGESVMGKVLKGFSRRRRLVRRVLIIAALVLLESLFLGSASIMSEWLVANLGWVTILVANALAVLSMGVWIWRRRPMLREGP